MKIWNKIRQKRTETDKNPKESGHEKDNWLERHLLVLLISIQTNIKRRKKKLPKSLQDKDILMS